MQWRRSLHSHQGHFGAFLLCCLQGVAKVCEKTGKMQGSLRLKALVFQQTTGDNPTNMVYMLRCFKESLVPAKCKEDSQAAVKKGLAPANLSGSEQCLALNFELQCLPLQGI